MRGEGGGGRGQGGGERREEGLGEMFFFQM